MKRSLKLILNLLLALVAVALTLLILFFITPSWQKSALEGVLARDTARQWQVGSVNLQPGSLEMEQVFVLDGSVGAEVKFLELDGPFWMAPFTQTVQIDSGSVVGLDLDVSQVPVGDPTSVDYQAFLHRVSTDEAFWKERIGLVLSKLSATGLHIRVRDLDISGQVRMPGKEVVPVRWTIIQADSSAPRLTRIRPQGPETREL